MSNPCTNQGPTDQTLDNSFTRKGLLEHITLARTPAPTRTALNLTTAVSRPVSRCQMTDICITALTGRSDESANAVFFGKVPELPEAEAKEVRCTHLHAVGLLQCPLDVRALDVLQVLLQIEPRRGEGL